MNAIELVKAKKPLGKSVFAEVVGGFLSGSLSKEEMTEFLRAVCAFGLSDEDATPLLVLIPRRLRSLSPASAILIFSFKESPPSYRASHFLCYILLQFYIRVNDFYKINITKKETRP